MIGYGDRARTQCEVVRLFRETHPDLPPLNQGTIRKIEAHYREMDDVRKVPSKMQAVVDDDTKLNLLLALEENPITPARQLARDKNLNQNSYSEMLNTFFWPKLDEENLEYRKKKRIFNRTDASPIQQFRSAVGLTNNLEEKWIGRYGPICWPARSPDLSPLDFFLWGFSKEIVYRQPIGHNTDLLKTRIIQAVAQVNQEMIDSTYTLLERDWRGDFLVGHRPAVIVRIADSGQVFVAIVRLAETVHDRSGLLLSSLGTLHRFYQRLYVDLHGRLQGLDRVVLVQLFQQRPPIGLHLQGLLGGVDLVLVRGELLRWNFMEYSVGVWSVSVVPGNNGLYVYISAAMHPTAQRSIGLLYVVECNNTSGALYHLVETKKAVSGNDYKWYNRKGYINKTSKYCP
ncbi:hypothetical protein NQ318_011969 [Aromia moschata]|uniref:DUF4817 domain-containing protein n=1 Tax=Aromia moschata TaxID=1265417 RepID=A0AAV8XYK9_9CUCU|nr:hypothetical protein NQ318_011969 [Aromia moschata]